VRRIWQSKLATLGLAVFATIFVTGAVAPFVIRRPW